MAPMVEDNLRTLGLPRSASAADARAAFRRLAKQHHPDVARAAADHRRFAEIVHAYRELQQAWKDATDEHGHRRCPTCRRWAELLEGLDGRVACLDCLLGESDRRRFLPLPVLVTVRHVGVMLCYAASAALGLTGHAGWSLLLVVAGLATLAVTCMRIRFAA